MPKVDPNFFELVRIHTARLLETEGFTSATRTRVAHEMGIHSNTLRRRLGVGWCVFMRREFPNAFNDELRAVVAELIAAGGLQSFTRKRVAQRMEVTPATVSRRLNGVSVAEFVRREFPEAIRAVAPGLSLRDRALAEAPRMMRNPLHFVLTYADLAAALGEDETKVRQGVNLAAIQDQIIRDSILNDRNPVIVATAWVRGHMEARGLTERTMREVWRRAGNYLFGTEGMDDV